MTWRAKTVEYCSWNHFQQQAIELESEESIFRGHSQQRWKLQTTWQRYCLSEDNGPWLSHHAELKSFRINIEKQGLNSTAWTDEQVEAMGRHYGLITHTFDWTKDPLIAAFFAFSGLFNLYTPVDFERQWVNQKGNVVIWELNPIDEIQPNQPPLRLIEPPNPPELIRTRDLTPMNDSS